MATSQELDNAVIVINNKEIDISNLKLETTISKIDSFVIRNSGKMDIFDNLPVVDFLNDLMDHFDLDKRTINYVWDNVFPDWPNAISVNNYLIKGIFLIAFFIYARRKNDIELYNIMKIYGMFLYTSLMYKYFKAGINTNIAYNAIEKLSGNHLFRKFDSSISKAIFKIVDDIVEIYKGDSFLARDSKIWYRFMLDIRVRINQSFRSFATKYYVTYAKMKESANEYNSDKIDQFELSNIVERIASRMQYNSYISSKSVDKTNAITRLSKNLISEMAATLTTPVFNEEIQFIYTVIFKEFISRNLKDQYFMTEVALEVFKMVIIAKNFNEDHLRYHLKILLRMLSEENEDIKTSYEKVTQRTKTKMELSLLVYLYFYSKDVLSMGD